MSKKPITVAARKNKGRKLQQLVRDKILENYPTLDDTQVRSTSMGAGGEDVQLSREARDLFPYSVECKRYKNFAIYTPYEQCQNNAGKHEPLLVIQGDRKKPLAIIDLDHFFFLQGKKDVP